MPSRLLQFGSILLLACVLTTSPLNRRWLVTMALSRSKAPIPWVKRSNA